MALPVKIVSKKAIFGFCSLTINAKKLAINPVPII